MPISSLHFYEEYNLESVQMIECIVLWYYGPMMSDESFRSASIEIGRRATIIESNRLNVKIKEFRRRNLHY